MNIKIEHSAKIPIRGRRGAVARYPYEKCNTVGDNFFIAGLSPRQGCQATAYWNRKYEGTRHFVVRRDEHMGVSGVRIYRDK